MKNFRKLRCLGINYDNIKLRTNYRYILNVYTCTNVPTLSNQKTVCATRSYTWRLFYKLKNLDV